MGSLREDLDALDMIKLYNAVADGVPRPEPPVFQKYNQLVDLRWLEDRARDASTIREELVAAYDLAVSCVLHRVMLRTGARLATRIPAGMSLFHWAIASLCQIRLPHLRSREVAEYHRVISSLRYRSRRSRARAEALASPTAGPADSYLFCWKGRFTQLQPIPHRLLSYLWKAFEEKKIG